MNKLFTSFVVATLWFSFAVTSCVGSDVIVNGGVLDLEGTFGFGQNTSFFVFDFSGAPETTPGSRDSFAFGYRYDDPDTTVADALQALVADGSGLEFSFGGSSDEGFGLFIEGITFGDASDFPVFDEDDRFWQFFNGTLVDEEVQFTGSLVGISSLPLNDDGTPQAPLTDGSFSGFRAQQFDAGIPSVPVTAVPEPACLLVLFGASVGATARRRRR